MAFGMSETEDKDRPTISRKVANERTEDYAGDTRENQPIATACSCMLR